jgi:hypothetical protein
MFMAISAFVLQGMLVVTSQAMAVAGKMLEPSVTLSGSLHFHDQLAGHAHEHGGDNAEGHIHDGPDDDSGGPSLCWSIFGTSIAIPTFIALTRSADLLGLIEMPAFRRIAGVEPGGLIRPPSTLSIA